MEATSAMFKVLADGKDHGLPELIVMAGPWVAPDKAVRLLSGAVVLGIVVQIGDKFRIATIPV